MKIRTLIIDDEPHAREGLLFRLEKYDELEVVGECSSGSEAVKAINNSNPDLLFLDIQMPEMNGFEVLQNINLSPMPMVIFITAYDQHAIKAFEFHAIDYLLKPINNARLVKAVENAITIYQQRRTEIYSDKLKNLLDSIPSNARNNDSDEIEAEKPLNRIPIKTAKMIRFLNVDDIDWIESAGDYVYFHSNGKKQILREKLSALEMKLDKKKFIRIHRSSIVNISRIDKIRIANHGDYHLYLKDGTQLKLSRNFKSAFDKVIGYSL